MNCVLCDKEMIPTSCPDKEPGCLVAHYRCVNCEEPTDPNSSDLLVGYRLHSSNAKVPTYAHEGDAGADLYAVSFENVAWTELFNEKPAPMWHHHNEICTCSSYDVACTAKIILHPGRSVLVHTELSLYPPMGWEVSIRGRSGLAFKYGIVILHVGTGDAGFVGHYDVMLKNVSGAPYELKPGDRIAQAVFSRVGRAAFEEREAPQTQRGEKGYGSSGS